jgi:hypothetical protein
MNKLEQGHHAIAIDLKSGFDRVNRQQLLDIIYE